MPIGYGLVEDASHFEPFPDFKQPALIFHGDFDASVPVEYSIEFANTHPNARLIRLPSDHELTDSLEAIWAASEKSLRAAPLEV
jgi:pimeloyl-ACP methyl ester carboxylesterase